MTPEGLQPMLDVGIYGRIANMELFRPKVATFKLYNCIMQNLSRERQDYINFY